MVAKIALAFLCSWIFSGYFTAAASRPIEDMVTDLPGVNFQLRFEQYSGYLNISDDTFYHYWFFESQSCISNDPLILFMNGGPGCSSLAALFTECGPFRITKDGKGLKEHIFSWNRVANIVFLESPSGAGFSYSTARPNLTDDQNVIYHYRALEKFYDKFPEFKGRPLFLIGQSYAAVYVTTLARYILYEAAEFPGKLEGVVIGNGLLSRSLITNSRLYYNYYHGLIGEVQWLEIIDKCCKGQPQWQCDINRFYDNDGADICFRLVKDAINAADVGRDPFNINFECYHHESDYSNDEECGVPFGNITKHYLDQEEVRKAAHIPIERFSGYSFEACSADVEANYQKQYNDLTKITKDVLAVGAVRILVFNGDWDSVCNFFGAQWFVDGLGVEATGDRVPIFYAHISQKNVGYQRNYKNLDLLVIRGAGHYVPADRPGESLQILVNFLRGERNYSVPDKVNKSPAPLIPAFTSSGGPRPSYSPWCNLNIHFLTSVLAAILMRWQNTMM